LDSHETRSRLAAFFKELGLAPLVNEPLRKHCTWRIGGPADFLVEPQSWEQVASLLRYTHTLVVPTVIIGKGSNLLFDDAGLRGVVIKIGRKLSRVSIAGTTVHAESGVSASRLARTVGLAGLTGLEHIVGIPGTLGGLVVMNGGSRRCAIGDVIAQVKAIDYDGTVHVFSREDCEFRYRQSRFQHESLVITDVTMDLALGRRANVLAEMLDILRDRRKRFPLTLPNCGSVFKSDPDMYKIIGPPGKIIEALGLKGLRAGGAAIDARHANFIVNRGQACSADVLRLVHMIRSRVHDGTGCWLRCEFQYVGPRGLVRDLHDVPDTSDPMPHCATEVGRL